MMFRYLRHIALLGAMLLLAGCATMQERAAPDALSRVKRVGVVSLAAHEFHRQYTGFTVFGNERERHDIAAWKVDDEYETQMQSALSKLGREGVRIPGERKELYAVYDLTGADQWALRTLKWSNVEGRLKTIASRDSLDAVVVVVRRQSNDILAGSNQTIRGAGFYSRGAGDRTSVSVVHLFADAYLIDGRTGQPIANKILSRNQEGWPGTVARNSPIEKVAPELARAKFGELGEARTADVRRQLIELPRDAWEPTFRALFAAGSK